MWGSVTNLCLRLFVTRRNIRDPTLYGATGRHALQGGHFYAPVLARWPKIESGTPYTIGYKRREPSAVSFQPEKVEGGGRSVEGQRPLT